MDHSNNFGKSSDDHSGESDSSQTMASPKTGKFLLPLNNNVFQLELSVNFTLLQSIWTVNNVFRLEPISLERIRALEAKLCGVEKELEVARNRTAQENDNGMVHLDATSPNSSGVNDKNQICWDEIETNGFELSSNTAKIRCLVAGWYILSLAVF